MPPTFLSFILDIIVGSAPYLSSRIWSALGESLLQRGMDPLNDADFLWKLNNWATFFSLEIHDIWFTQISHWFPTSLFWGYFSLRASLDTSSEVHTNSTYSRRNVLLQQLSHCRTIGTEVFYAWAVGSPLRRILIIGKTKVCLQRNVTRSLPISSRWGQLHRMLLKFFGNYITIWKNISSLERVDFTFTKSQKPFENKYGE